MIKGNFLKTGILLVVFALWLGGTASIVKAAGFFDYYMQGLESLVGNTAEKNAEAIKFFQKAIEADPQEADAYLELAAAYAQKYRYFDKSEKWYIQHWSSWS